MNNVAHEPFASRLAMLRQELNYDETTVIPLRRYCSAAGPGERVDNDVAWHRERLNQWIQRYHRLFIRVVAVACVFPRQHIGNRNAGSLWSSFSEKEPDLMKALSVASPRTVLLWPNKMTDRPESTLLPHCHEFVDPRPAIEGDAESVCLEYSIEFSERRL